VIPRVRNEYDPARPVICSWSLPAALAADIERRASEGGIEAEQLVRELFLAHLPEFVADALADTLAELRGVEGVDSS
jgi:hypothetical protein